MEVSHTQNGSVKGNVLSWLSYAQHTEQGDLFSSCHVLWKGSLTPSLFSPMKGLSAPAPPLSCKRYHCNSSFPAMLKSSLLPLHYSDPKKLLLSGSKASTGPSGSSIPLALMCHSFFPVFLYNQPTVQSGSFVPSRWRSMFLQNDVSTNQTTICHYPVGQNINMRLFAPCFIYMDASQK